MAQQCTRTIAEGMLHGRFLPPEMTEHIPSAVLYCPEPTPCFVPASAFHDKLQWPWSAKHIEHHGILMHTVAVQALQLATPRSSLQAHWHLAHGQTSRTVPCRVLSVASVLFILREKFKERALARTRGEPPIPHQRFCATDNDRLLTMSVNKQTKSTRGNIAA